MQIIIECMKSDSKQFLDAIRANFDVVKVSDFKSNTKNSYASSYTEGRIYVTIKGLKNSPEIVNIIVRDMFDFLADIIKIDNSNTNCPHNLISKEEEVAKIKQLYEFGCKTPDFVQLFNLSAIWKRSLLKKL